MATEMTNAPAMVGQGAVGGKSPQQILAEAQTLTEQAVGDGTRYRGRWDEAARGLKQPAAGQEDITRGTQYLGKALAVEFYKKHGQFPTPEKLESMVSENLSPSLMVGTILKQNDYGKVVSDYAKPAAATMELDGGSQETGDEIQRQVQERLNAELANKTNALEKEQVEAGRTAIDEVFNPAKKSTVEDALALGINKPGIATLAGDVDSQKRSAMTKLMGDISSQRSARDYDLAKSLEAIFAGERRAGEQGEQFGQELAFKNKALGASETQNMLDRIFQEGENDKKLRLQRDYMDKGDSPLDLAAKSAGIFTGLLGAANATAGASADYKSKKSGGKGW